MFLSSAFLPDMRQLPAEYTNRKVMQVNGVCCLCQKKEEGYKIERILSTDLRDYLQEERFLYHFPIN